MLPVKPSVERGSRIVLAASPGLAGRRHPMPSASQVEVDGASRLFWAFVFEMTKNGYDIRRHGEDGPSYDPVTGAHSTAGDLVEYCHDTALSAAFACEWTR